MLFVCIVAVCIETVRNSPLFVSMLLRDCFTVSIPVHMGKAPPKCNAVVLNFNERKSPKLFHSMTVSQYDHVVAYTDLGGRGYFVVLRRSSL